MYVVIFITAANKKEAARIGQYLVKNKLAACVNITKEIQSVFRWQGKVDRAKEVLLVVKTKKSLVTRLIRKVQSIHSYDLPEIIALPIIAGSKKYLDWINASTR